jgi:two-component system OmpR family response regulator
MVAHGADEGGGRRLRAVVVDDHEAARLLARLILERFGFTVATAASAEECRARLTAGRPDLVLVDRILGADDGLTVARAAAAPDTAVVVASGLARPEALPDGVAGWLTKPYTPRQMYAVLAAALGTHGKSLARERIV